MNATGSSIDWYRSQYLHWQHAASLVFCLFMFPWKPDFRAALKNLGTTNLRTMKISHSNGWSKSKCTFLQLKSGWNERRPVLPSSSNLQPASIMKRLTGTLEAREFCSHRSCKDFTKSVSISHLISTFLSYAFHVPTITLHINGHQRVFPLKLDHCCNFILGPDKDWAKARSQVWHKAGSTLSSFQLRFHVKAMWIWDKAPNSLSFHDVSMSFLLWNSLL